MEKIRKRIILEVNHPGQVHLFKYVYHELVQRKHFIKVITKENPVIEYLLKVYDIPYSTIGKKKKQILNKLLWQLIHDYNAFRIVKKFNIGLGIGSSITNDHVSKLSKMESIHFSDDDEEVVPYISKFSYPFTNAIISPDCTIFNSHSSKVVGYAGYHELAYLHPNRFTPDYKDLEEIGLDKGDIYFVLRFNAFEAHHDGNAAGLNINQKLRLIDELSPHGRIIITSEKNLESELSQYQLSVAPEKMHSILAFATIFIGDSQTMTSESAVLGIPSLRCNTFAGRLSTLNELEEKYGLAYSYQPQDFELMILKLRELIANQNLREEWTRKRIKMLDEKIDVTGFYIWFLENYPKSIEIMKGNPDHQFRFK